MNRISDKSYGRLFRVWRLGVWWNYDLTFGSAWSWSHLQRRGRFYGVTIGQCCIGLTYFRKEKRA